MNIFSQGQGINLMKVKESEKVRTKKSAGKVWGIFLGTQKGEIEIVVKNSLISF